MHITIHELLNIHTLGQLRLMGLASRISYHNMQKSSKKESRKEAQFNDNDAGGKPLKPVSKMTKDELEAYYHNSGI